MANTCIRGCADLELVPRVDIWSMDTVVLGTTEMDGAFEIAVPSHTNKFLIGWVGMESQTINLISDCNTVNILLMYAGSTKVLLAFLSANITVNLPLKKGLCFLLSAAYAARRVGVSIFWCAGPL
jgi:hypothetical protein